VIYDFENFSLDADRRELRRGTSLVTIEPQVFDLLQYLIRNRERVLSKDDLIGAVWNGRMISESTLSSRITAVRHAVNDRGEEQRLIRTVARKGFRFVGDVREGNGPNADGAGTEWQEPAHHDFQAAQALQLPGKPTIAVLPFASISENPEQEGFVNGIVEDITTELSQFCWLSVIARSLSFAHKGWAVDIKHVRRDLGVHFVLEGSVRQAAGRVRVTARLIDTMTGAHLWANRFDAWHEDIFSLQDQITASVVGAIGPKLEQVEIERARREPPESLDCLHYYLRGMGNIYQWTRDGMNDALSLFHKAFQIDPEFASAYGMAAYCYVQRKSYGWIADRMQETAECARLARRAAELAKDDAAALSKAAHAIASVARDIDSGAVFIDQALKLNPNLAAGWYVSGWIRLFLGDPDVAIEHLAHAISLSPFDPLIFKMHAALAYAHFFAGRYDDASAMAASALRTRPNYLTAVRAGAASHALAGRLDRAQNLMAHMRKRDSALRISNLKELVPLCRSEDFTRWADGLRKAGLPE
jgi:TolB-like protein/Tfp pilus assembly protein PilF